MTSSSEPIRTAAAPELLLRLEGLSPAVTEATIRAALCKVLPDPAAAASAGIAAAPASCNKGVWQAFPFGRCEVTLRSARECLAVMRKFSHGLFIDGDRVKVSCVRVRDDDAASDNDEATVVEKRVRQRAEEQARRQAAEEARRLRREQEDADRKQRATAQQQPQRESYQPQPHPPSMGISVGARGSGGGLLDLPQHQQQGGYGSRGGAPQDRGYGGYDDRYDDRRGGARDMGGRGGRFDDRRYDDRRYDDRRYDDRRYDDDAYGDSRRRSPPRTSGGGPRARSPPMQAHRTERRAAPVTAALAPRHSSRSRSPSFSSSTSWASSSSSSRGRSSSGSASSSSFSSSSSSSSAGGDDAA